ncbi:MAG: hypothetical protein VB070_00595 [Clostridiaceae bacterium]|nr:hypothetical protein [Clostridiaceae bacterium]
MAAADSLRRMTRDISWGGMLTALTLCFLIAAALSPIANLALYALTSLCIAAAVVEMDERKAVLVYLAAALISLAYPGWTQSWPFILFFGLYPLLRAPFDRRFKTAAAWLARNAAGFLLGLLSAALFFLKPAQNLAGRYGFWIWLILPVLLAAAMMVYDYALSLLLQFYCGRLRHKT